MAYLSIVFLAVLAGACYAQAPNRIVGGQATTVENYPSIVLVESRGLVVSTWSHSCGGNILNSVYILSAAHCFYGPLSGTAYRRIRAGTSYRNTGGIVVGIQEIINHATFSIFTGDGDVSVLRLSSALPLGPTIQQGTIIYPNAFIPDNVPVVHAGWGLTTQGGSPSSVLQDVTIYTVNRELCRERYASNPNIPATMTITDNMLCVGLMDVGGKGACQGDSGGPLYWNGVIVGVVSWGDGCANDTYPGVNANVASYTDWIVSVAV